MFGNNNQSKNVFNMNSLFSNNRPDPRASELLKKYNEQSFENLLSSSNFKTSKSQISPSKLILYEKDSYFCQINLNKQQIHFKVFQFTKEEDSKEKTHYRVTIFNQIISKDNNQIVSEMQAKELFDYMKGKGTLRVIFKSQNIYQNNNAFGGGAPNPQVAPYQLFGSNKNNQPKIQNFKFSKKLIPTIFLKCFVILNQQQYQVQYRFPFDSKDQIIHPEAQSQFLYYKKHLEMERAGKTQQINLIRTYFNSMRKDFVQKLELNRF